MSHILLLIFGCLFLGLEVLHSEVFVVLNGTFVVMTSGKVWNMIEMSLEVVFVERKLR